nr:hypothetical protein RKHAN_01165 [Rhizobium sp. Khangiran2]
MNLADAKALLPEIRGVIELASEDWAESYSMESGRPQIAGRHPMTGEIYPIATLEKAISYDDRLLIRKAPLYVRALLILRDEAVRAYLEATKPPPEPKPDPKDFAAEASMKCKNDRAFARYLEERHELQDASNGERIKTRVRSILSVQSLAELNTDPQAAERWKALRSDFKTWLKQ